MTDMAWLAPDPVLAHRDVLLDAATMRHRIANVLCRGRAPRIGRCETVRVNYQVGKSLRVLFTIERGGTQRFVAARMFRAGRSGDAFSRAAAVAGEGNGTLPVAHDPEIDCVFWSFPSDRKIATLPLLAAPPGELARSIRGAWQSSRIVAYAPEKSATAACLNRAGEVIAYAKVSAADQTRRDFGFYQALGAGLAENDPYLRIPGPLAFSDVLRILWLEAIHGRAVGGDSPDDLRRVGAALGRFHECAVANAPVFTRYDSERLAAAADVFTSLRPDLQSAADNLAERLIAARPPATDVVCLHGDVHPKNAIVTGERVALLDVEDLARGPSAADLGSFIASLLYLHVSGCLSREAYASRASAFLSGYTRVRPLPERTVLAWHVAAALFIERAVRAVTRMRPLGLSNLAALVERADRIVTGGLYA